MSSRKTIKKEKKIINKTDVAPGTTYLGSKNAEKMKIEGKLEAPECYYTISAKDLVDLLDRNDMVNNGDSGREYEKLAGLFSDLRKYEDYSILNKPPRQKKNAVTDESFEHQTEPPFEEKIVNALFWLPSKKGGEYKYIRIRLAPSNIKAAGIGAYAVDLIPKGAKGVYKGVPKSEDNANMYYAWVVKTFDPDTGEVTEDDEPIYYVDATDLKTSNWTRYVNCGMRSKFNNFDSEQLYDKFFYVATRNIEPNEELLIDYGNSYREDNLGMTGKY